MRGFNFAVKEKRTHTNIFFYNPVIDMTSSMKQFVGGTGIYKHRFKLGDALI